MYTSSRMGYDVYMNATTINEFTKTYSIEDHGDYAQVDLDWTGTEREAMKFAAEFFCRTECVNKVGPGGGWPVYRFEGVFPSVCRLVKAYDE